MNRIYGLGDAEASLVGEPELPPCDYGKSQWVRLSDVLAVGPLMIWGGYALHRQSKLAGWALGLMGVATIGLNGYNFVRFGGFASASQEGR